MKDRPVIATGEIKDNVHAEVDNRNDPEKPH